MSVGVDQKRASAQGDVVGHDKITEVHIHEAAASSGGVVEQLLRKLEAEIADNAKTQETIEALKRYYRRRSHDGIDGLEAKLDASGRHGELHDALEKKEMFAKLLERWSLYASAQQIFVHLLARAEHEFNYNIYPKIESLQPVQVNELVTNKIVSPVVAECGSTLFAVDHGMALGMLYWLAEQCFVRWHK
jgi:vacuolar-type H+-ATPase subunit I/STV1